MKSIKLSAAVIVFIALAVNLVIGAEGVYFYQYDDEKKESSYVLKEFDSSGGIEIGETGTGGYERIYLGVTNGNPEGLVGFLRNVKIKKEGDGISVEFRDKGLMMRASISPLSLHNYDGIKPGGKFHFDSKGNMIKAEIEAAEKTTFYLNKQGYEVPEGAELKLENEKITVTMKKGGEFSYFDEETRKKTGFTNIKSGGKFDIDKQGEVVKAEFEVSQKTKISIGGWSYNVPENALVKFDGSKIEISLPEGAKLEEPEKTDAESKVTFSFKSKSGGLVLPNNDVIEATGEETVISYSEGFYFNGKNGIIKRNGIEEVLISNPSGEIFLVFDESKMGEKNSVFLGESRIILSSLKGEGAAIYFKEGNSFGVITDSEHSASVQAIEGKIIVNKAEPNRLAGIGISGKSIVTLDRRSFYSKGDNELYFNSEGKSLGGFPTGEYDASVRVSLVDNNGNNLRDFEVYSNGRDQYASASPEDFRGQMEFFKTGGNFYVSAKTTFNQLTPDAQNFYSKMDQEMQSQLAEYAGSEKEGTALLQRKLTELITEEEEKVKRNPYFASARLSSIGGRAGGSATMIGVDKEGHPIAITAGHVVRTPGQRVQLTIKEEGGVKSYTGSVIGGTHSPDVALIKIDQINPDIPYTTVGSMDDVREGSLVIRMGYPANKGRAFEAIQARITQIIGGDDRVHASEEIGPYPGSSGGGLFANGKLIGITSRAYGWGTGTGGYTTPDDMRDILKKYNYDYLIIVMLSICDY